MRIAVDAMGGDRAPGEIVAGALAAVDQLGVEVLLVGDRGRRAGRAARRQGPRRGRGRRLHAGHRDARRARRVGPHQEGRVRRARGRGGARRAGRRDGRGRQHRRDDGQRAAALRPDQGRDPPGGRRCRSRCRSRRPHLLVDGGRHGRLHARVADPVRLHGPDVRPDAARRRSSRRSGCSRTARRRARATTCASRRSPRSTATRGSSATSRAGT